MKIEETEKLNLQYSNTIQSTTSQINHGHDSDNELAEKFTQILNIYQKNSNFKGKPSFKNVVHYCRRYGNSIAECRQKKQKNQNKLQKQGEPNNFLNQFTKKGQILPMKSIHSKKKAQENPFQTTTLILDNNHFTEIIFAEVLQTEEVHKIFGKIDIADQIVGTISFA